MAKLYFKYGAMGSSKTATALITKYNYEERGMRVWLIKPAADRRDGEFTLRSRIGLTAQCEAIGPECDLRERYAAHGKADVIIVDECQFLTGEQIDQLRELVDRENLPVLCFGLRTEPRTGGSVDIFMQCGVQFINTALPCLFKAMQYGHKRISFLFFSSYHIPTASATENTGLPAAVMPSKQ